MFGGHPYSIYCLSPHIILIPLRDILRTWSTRLVNLLEIELKQKIELQIDLALGQTAPSTGMEYHREG